MKPWFIRNIIFLCIMGTLSDLDGQMLNCRKYTIEDGLNQTEVSGSMMMFDSTYYVWEGNRSLSRFDGYAFEPIDSIDYRPYVINYYVNASESSYFFDGGLIFYDGISFKNITPPWEHRGFYYQKDKMHMVNEHYEVFFHESPTSEWVFEKHVDDTFKSQIKNKEQYLESVDGRFAGLFTKTKYQFFENTSPDKRLINPHDYIQSADKELLSTIHISDQTIFNPDYRFYTKYLRTKPNKFSVVRSTAGDFLLVNINSGGVVGKIPNAAAFVFEVNDQCVMLSSHAGLIKVNPKIEYFKSGEGNMVNALHTIFEDESGKIWFGGYGDGLCYWDGVEMKKADLLAGATIMPGAAAIKGKGNYLLCDGNSRGLYQLKESELHRIQFTINKQKISGFYVKQLTNENIAVGLATHGLGILEKDSLKVISKEKGLNLKNVLAIAEDKGERLWCMGSSKGVGVYDMNRDTAITFESNRDIVTSFGGVSIAYDSKDRLWFGTMNGVKVLENVSSFDMYKDHLFDHVKAITLPDGGNSIVTSIRQIDDYIVVGNNTAISFIDLKSYDKNPSNPFIFQLIYGEDIQGGGSEQNTIFIDSQRRLWVGSQDGASVIDWDNFTFDHTVNSIKIKSAIAGNQQLSISKENEIRLPVDNRNCEISFGPDKNVSLLKNIFFDYHLLNESGDTLSSVWYDQKGVFKSSYIPPGSYTLVINAKKHGQLMDSKTITICAPFSLSENPYFWGGLSTLLIGLLSWFFIFRATQLKKSAEKELELSKLKYDKESLQIQTIISSFNPHFINNSLHWAQSRYRKDDELVKVIGRLSENIRYIFQNTRKGKAYHNLQDELNLVDNYIEIQKIRFKNSFEYKSPSLPKIEHLLGQKILLLQLQIHVENAIEHGLRNREGSTYVSLNVKDNGDEIIITIEDDGIGRKGAEILGSRGTQSGTSMMSELHKIFNSKNKNPILTTYEDAIFIDKSGAKYGTRVIINLPKVYNFEV